MDENYFSAMFPDNIYAETGYCKGGRSRQRKNPATPMWKTVAGGLRLVRFAGARSLILMLNMTCPYRALSCTSLSYRLLHFLRPRVFGLFYNSTFGKRCDHAGRGSPDTLARSDSLRIYDEKS